MSYADSDQVISLLSPGGDYDGVTDLTPFINTADVWIRALLKCAAIKGLTPDPADLAVIANWLAAHAYVMSDQTYTQKQTDRAAGQFKSSVGPRFQLSNYGQTAMTLDSTGCLEVINQPQKKVGGFWGGKVPCDQIPYWQRKTN
jgi:hypothetical protein